MKKEFHYYYNDAAMAANAFANKTCCSVCPDITVDERTLMGCEYMDDKANNLSWSGEVSAIPVEDENCNIIGLFAYWE